MKSINISTEKFPNTFVMVDDSDYMAISEFRWSPNKTPYTTYAVRFIKENGKQRKIYMHRQIMESQGRERIDHRDGSGLNNCRSNMRRATSSQNNCNHRGRRTNTSGYIGVSWDKKRCKWAAYLRAENRQHRLGRFDSKEKAARVRDSKAMELHGDFAVLNFPKNFPK